MALAIATIVSFSAPTYAADNGVTVSLNQSVVKKNKKTIKKEYLEAIKKINQEYRAARDKASSIFKANLAAAKDKGKRAEIRKHYNQALKEAREVMQAAKKEAVITTR